MARKVFTLNTTPHEIEIGDKVLLFVPEVDGDEWVEQLMAMSDTQKALRAGGDDAIGGEEARDAMRLVREFLVKWMLPESIEDFTGMKLPLRAVMQLFEWVQEFYGNDTAEQRPPTSQPASAPRSQRTGTTSTRASSSRASTSTR
jgi:hypothetical protein